MLLPPPPLPPLPPPQPAKQRCKDDTAATGRRLTNDTVTVCCSRVLCGKCFRSHANAQTHKRECHKVGWNPEQAPFAYYLLALKNLKSVRPGMYPTSPRVCYWSGVVWCGLVRGGVKCCEPLPGTHHLAETTITNFGWKSIYSSNNITAHGEARQGMAECISQGKARQITAQPIPSE